MITQIIRMYDETAYNRAYLASCLWHSAQVLLRGTSDTLGTLGESALFTLGVIIYQGDNYEKRKGICI
jgi:hypothetical protein